jgi:hypothetical protein
VEFGSGFVRNKDDRSFAVMEDGLAVWHEHLIPAPDDDNERCAGQSQVGQGSTDQSTMVRDIDVDQLATSKVVQV